MLVPENRPGRSVSSMVQVDATLFVWRGAGIVLIGERSEGRWIVARGWIGPGKLTDVRRWSFDNPRSFGGQVRRLTLEATGDAGEANVMARTATEWASTLA